MSPSNAKKSLEGNPATFGHIQQPLLKADVSNIISSSGNTADAAYEEGRRKPSGSTDSNIPSNVTGEGKVSNSEVDHSVSEAGTSKATLGTQSNILPVSNTPSLTSPPNDRQEIPLESSAIESSILGFPEVLSVANKSEGAMPIKPKPPLSVIKVADAVASEGTKKSPTNNSSTTALILPTKSTDRTVGAPSTKSKGTARRRGKWTIEEEEYVARVIQDFNSGYLNAPAGYTLRSYLSDKLQCDPMRITKKFTGESCIGKRVFHPAVRNATNAAAIDKAQSELDALERRWRRRLEMQQRESAKKAAASAAAANAANRGAVTVQGVPVSMLGSSSQNPSDSQLQQSAVTQAATWLDRANVILMGKFDNGNQTNSSFRGKICTGTSQQENNKDGSTSTQSSAEDSLEHQMKEVQRLIYEGPIIQQTTAGLPNVLLQTSASTSTPVYRTTNNANTTNTITATLSNSGMVGTMPKHSSSAHVSPTLEPADKRMKTSITTAPDTTGAEGAEALLGFLSSVRASAAAGQEL